MVNKYLLKSTNEVRVETESETQTLKQELLNAADEMGATLTNFSVTLKEVKAGGEVVEIYFVVKYTLFFDIAKAPERAPLREMQYIFNDGGCFE